MLVSLYRPLSLFPFQGALDGLSLPTNEADLMKELSRIFSSRETHDVESKDEKEKTTTMQEK